MLNVMLNEIKIMKKRLYIIALLSIVAIAVNAQTTTSSNLEYNAIQSQQIIKTSAYSGTVYEPFSSTTPSEQSTVGAQYTQKTSGPRRSKENPTDPGITDDNSSPLGDVVWPLMAMLAVYSAARVYRCKRRV